MKAPWRRPSSQLAVEFSVLEAALAEGWAIDPPVCRRQVPERPDGTWYCDVILWCEGQVRLLTVADTPSLHTLLTDRGMAVEA